MPDMNTMENTHAHNTRTYALAILAILGLIIVIATCIGGYRSVIRSASIRLTQSNSVALAKSVALAIEAGHFTGQGHLALTKAPLDDDTYVMAMDDSEKLLDLLLRELHINNLDIHDKTGQIIYSSHRERIGRIPAHDESLRTALAGMISSRPYRLDTRDAASSADPFRNIVTYVPLYRESDEALLAVLGIHMDTDPEISKYLSTRMMISIALVLAPLMLAMLGAIALLRHRRQKRRPPVLYGLQETTDLPGRCQTINAQETERKRISRELHDGIGQYLNAIKMRLQQIAGDSANGLPPAIAGNIDAVLSIVSSSIDEVRRISLALRPIMLDDLGLLATISWLCREFESAHPDIAIQTRIDVEEHDIPDRLKTTIYRILQESLTNASKHSHATQVGITLCKARQKRAETLVLTIEDNGIGFNVHNAGRSAHHGLGLPSMRERTELDGGSLTITSKPHGGTRIHACWPLPECAGQTSLESPA